MQRQFLTVVLVSISWVLSLIMMSNHAFAHGVVGKRLFVEPIVTEDANVFSEFDLLIPSFIRGENDEKELELGSSLTLRLTENLGLEIEQEWVNRNPLTGPNLTGFSDFETVLKYVAHVNPKREWIFTVALIWEPPIGKDNVREGDFHSFGTGVFYGKGFGDLPEWAKYLRPLALQGDVVIKYPVDRDPAKSFNTLTWNFAFYYSIPYLQQSVKDFGIPSPYSRLFPMLEISSERILNGPNVGLREIIARPGVMWVGKSVQVGLAAILPMNEAARDEVDAGVTGIISLYLDDLFPIQFKDPLL
ncbi:MAG: hypothetical protein ACE5HN_05710 [Nitrospiria bacterium]